MISGSATNAMVERTAPSSEDRPKVIMLGPALDATSGISAVVQKWLRAGLRDKVQLRYVPTLDEYVPGQYLKKTGNALRALWTVATAPRWGGSLLHLHVSTGASFYRKLVCGLIGKWRGDRLVVHLHGSTFEQFHASGSRARKALIRWFFNRADTVIVLSESWKRFLSGICRPRRLEIIYNGAFLMAPTDAQTTLRQGEGQDGTDVPVRILTLGRLGQRKGTYDLVRAFESVVKRVPSARLTLAGDGDLDAVRALVDEKGLGSTVSIVGWISGETKDRALQGSDIYVLPSYNEGLPGSILEAMSFGMPVVSTPVGGIPEAVEDRVNGFLVEAGDIDLLADRLVELCRSTELREKMGRHSRDIVTERFDVHKIVDQLVTLYRSMGPGSAQVAEP